MLDILNKPRIQEEHYEANPALIEEYYAEVESEMSAINDNPFVVKDEPTAEEVVGDVVEESKDVLVTPILHDLWDHSLIIEAGFDLLFNQLFEISISLCRHFPTVDTLFVTASDDFDVLWCAFESHHQCQLLDLRLIICMGKTMCYEFVTSRELHSGY
ncbi:hypothetical protein Taro_014865 [Colocasia esculenta]|uniref:Uncharacterized protein n=1 Tax=Colocasia esculenta TaxID=4460 RepID=A0A843UKM0_COLES|nr:hypothetical protein [Colocasia esculenta]